MSAIPKFFRVTQVKSTIAVPFNKKYTLARLGLKKRDQTVYHKITRQQAGMIASVKELVRVELSPVKKSKHQLREERKSNPGFEVVARRR